MNIKDLDTRGPFVKKGDVISDREIFASEMDPTQEFNFDKYMHLKGVNESAKKELALRNLNTTFESLAESFK